MTHKTNPKSLRLTINEDWESKWLPKKPKDFSLFLVEDDLIRKLINKKFRFAGIAKIRIERLSYEDIHITIETSRPGLIIGRQGKEIENLKKELEEAIKKYRQERKMEYALNLKLEVEEVRRGQVRAAIVARDIAFQLEKRANYKRVMKKALADIMAHSDVKGAKIRLSGRLAGAEIARSEWIKEGNLPLQTLRAKIDYAFDEAVCSYGKIGIKVWIYKGDSIEDEPKE